jgi:TolB-like protein/Flp pilus assembly protein TadD
LPDKPSIAVLPFVNMSGDPEQEYFSDGITEDLITDLSKIAGLFVIGRSSTFTYKGKNIKTRQVAEELGVRYVLEGSVRKADKQVRINAQLIDATNGHHLWADRYDGQLSNIFDLQDKVTGKIVSALALKLSAGEKEQVSRKETDSIEAYDAFLKGWGHYLRRAPMDFAQARSYFERAIDLDANYGRAYAALARTYWSCSQNWPSPTMRVHKTMGISWAEARMRAREYLQIAMKNPTSIAHTLASEMNLTQRLPEKAIAEAKRAIALDPNEADNHATMARALIFAGKPKEAMDFVKRAMRLDPHNIAHPLYLRGLSQFCMGELEEAATSIERALTHNPKFSRGSGVLAAAYARLGRDQQARTALGSYKKGIMNRFAILRLVIYFWPFKDLQVAERFADGLLRAGLPGQPSIYYKISDEHRLTGEEIRDLFFGRTVTSFYRYHEWKKDHLEYRTKDGKATWRAGPDDYHGQDDSGISWVEGDMLCNQWQMNMFGMKHCMPVFPNPEGTPEMKNEYIGIPDFMFVTFSPVD